MDYLEGLSGVDTFNKSGVASAAGTNLKYAQDMYKVHLQKKPRNEHPPMIPKRECKALIEDAKENKMRQEGKKPPSATRLLTF